jgi:DNA (cytosine-5)-methyltransferase 1
VMVRAAEVLEPRAVLVENVPALERDSRHTLHTAIAHFERLGYKVDHGVVSVADIGVPQLRMRHVLLAHRSVKPDLESALNAAHAPNRTLRWAIGDLRDRCGSTGLDRPATLSPENARRARHLLKHGLYDLPNAWRPECQQDAHKYKSMYGRLRWDKPAQTITTGFGSPGQGRYLHPDQLRTLTAHEAARIQFFPDWFDFGSLDRRGDLARAIGNAVPPKLAFVLAHHLLSLGKIARLSRERHGASVSILNRGSVSAAIA